MNLIKFGGSALATILIATTATNVTTAQERELTILSHKVHENVARGLVPGTTGGDIAGEWATRHNVKLNWISGNIDPIHDRLFRELSLNQSSVDLAFVINKFQTPRISSLLEPLGPHLESAPVEIFADIPQNLLAAVSYDGALTAIPFRHATTGLHWNKALFAEQGLDHAPTTPEELIEYARKLTYTRPDGTRVHGLIMNSGDEHLAVLTFLSAFGASLFGPDLSVTADTPEMIAGLTVLADLYAEGVLATNYATLTIDDVITAMQNGTAAMAIDPFARYTVYNNPDTSKFSGQIDVVTLPGAGGDTALTEIWSMAIPANAQNKDLAWSLIQELTTAENTIRIALNGNGPVDPHAYSDTRLQARLPYTQEEAKAISIAGVIPSSFDRSLEALTIFREESQAAVLGFKTPADAAQSMQARIVALLPGR